MAKQRRKILAQIVLLFETWFGAVEKCSMSFEFPRFIHTIVPKGSNHPVARGSEWAGVLNVMKVGIEGVEGKIEGVEGKIEGKIESVEARIEENKIAVEAKIDKLLKAPIVSEKSSSDELQNAEKPETNLESRFESLEQSVKGVEIQLQQIKDLLMANAQQE